MHVAPQVMPVSKVRLEMASMEWPRSWSRNWPHCIAMWLRVGSGDVFEEETRRLLTLQEEDDKKEVSLKRSSQGFRGL